LLKVKPRVESSEPGDEGRKRVIDPGSPFLVLLPGADPVQVLTREARAALARRK
jgi:hypothetical protein